MTSSLIRLGFFLAAIAIFGLLELFNPWSSSGGLRRKGVNLSLGLMNALLLRFVVPVSLTWVAILGASHHVGLLNITAVPTWLHIPVSLVIMDLVIYVQHVASHHVSFLWRVHRVHHSDPSLDITSGIRFHPLEMFFSFLVKGGAILLFGIPGIAVVLFQVILNVSSVFTHANLVLNNRLDRFIRELFVTPAMHRVHHSTIYPEFNTNFGFNLSIWDRLFHTYRETSSAGDTHIPLGLLNWPDRNPGLIGLMMMPFNRMGA